MELSHSPLVSIPKELYLDRAPSVSRALRGPVQTQPSHARIASPHSVQVDATMPVNNTLYLILSFIAVFSVPVIAFVKKMTGAAREWPEGCRGHGLRRQGR